MGKRKITSFDVAEMAGVSQAAVSMILNKKNNVSFSKEVIHRVEDAADKLGYKLPAGKARKKERKAKVLVIIVPNFTNPYYLMLAQGVETRASEYGYSIFLCNMHHEEKSEEYYLKIIAGMNIRGLIYTCNPSKKCMRQLNEIAGKIPVVIINNRDKNLNIDTIEIDNTKLGRLMAEHLINLGHRHVAYIASPLLSGQRQRRYCVEGFVETFEKKGLKNNVVIKTPDIDGEKKIEWSEYKIGYDMTKELLQTNTELTAIVGMNDMIALGIFDALQDEKYRVPMDISVMGCDNTLISGVRRIALTTIEHFVVYKGMDACDILLKKISLMEQNFTEVETISTYHIEYEPRLVVRGTTGRVKKLTDKNNLV